MKVVSGMKPAINLKIPEETCIITKLRELRTKSDNLAIEYDGYNREWVNVLKYNTDRNICYHKMCYLGYKMDEIKKKIDIINMEIYPGKKKIDGEDIPLIINMHYNITRNLHEAFNVKTKLIVKFLFVWKIRELCKTKMSKAFGVFNILYYVFIKLLKDKDAHVPRYIFLKVR